MKIIGGRAGFLKCGFYTGNGINCPLGEIDDHRLLSDHAGEQLVEAGTLLLAFFGGNKGDELIQEGDYHRVLVLKGEGRL